MIQSISIRNIALIDRLTIYFHSGLQVLSGETGAGKSIVVDAMKLKNEDMGNFFSYNHAIGGVDILVYERDLERAREILERNAQEEGLDEDFDVNEE